MPPCLSILLVVACYFLCKIVLIHGLAKNRVFAALLAVSIAGILSGIKLKKKMNPSFRLILFHDRDKRYWPFIFRGRNCFAIMRCPITFCCVCIYWPRTFSLKKQPYGGAHHCCIAPYRVWLLYFMHSCTYDPCGDS